MTLSTTRPHRPVPALPGLRLARTIGGNRPTGLDPDGRVVVSELGDPDAAVVVLVHGIGVSERYFRPLAAELATDRRVLVPDLPGFGRSRTPRPRRVPTVPDLARVVLGVLRRRGVRRAVLVGHSMGAQVVAEAALQAPDLVERVVLVGPVVDPAAPTVAGQAWRLARDGLHEPARANAVVVTDYLRAGPRWYAAVLPQMFAYDTRAAVTELAAEVVVVRGRDDRVCSREWGRSLADAAPRGALREVPGGHVAMATASDAIARWARDGAQR